MITMLCQSTFPKRGLLHPRGSSHVGCEGSSEQQNSALKPRGHGRVRFPPLFSSSPTNFEGRGLSVLAWGREAPRGSNHSRSHWFRPAALPLTEGGVGTGAVEHRGREESGGAPRFRADSGDRGTGAVHWGEQYSRRGKEGAESTARCDAAHRSVRGGRRDAGWRGTRPSRCGHHLVAGGEGVRGHGGENCCSASGGG